MPNKEEELDLGHAALAVGELLKAETHYRAATQCDETDAESWHALGMVLYKQANYPEAIAAVLKAAAINPQDQMMWTSLSLAYMKNGQIPEAEAAGAKAKVISWGGKVTLDHL